MKTPYIASDWQLLFRPRRSGRYVNDHTIYRDHQGTWHLAGITGFSGRPTKEKYFVHAVSDRLDTPMKEQGKIMDHGTLAWAPCVVEHGGDYYMFYGPSPTKLAVSPDSVEWFGQELTMANLPPMACHRDHFVLKLSDRRWLLYATGIHNRKSSICCLESTDLLTWQFRGFALTSGPDAPLNPSWGALESPYVVHDFDGYYLFTTYTDCSRETYHDTLVFFSEDPFNFGCYNGPSQPGPITTLRAHAPEILRDGEEWKITTCGWRRSSFTGGAVKIASLQWK